MTETDATEWPREIWAFAIDYSEFEISGTYATSEFATFPRWEGDKERDRPVQRYVDADIYDSSDRYWRERVEALEAQLAEAERRAAIREEHAEWSQASFGDVSAIGPAKHLSKEALEVAADPRDIMEHVDCQFLLWDMQRRAGFSDAEITDAMTQKLPILKSRKYPPPKEGEPREHDRSIRALPLTEGDADQ